MGMMRGQQRAGDRSQGSPFCMWTDTRGQNRRQRETQGSGMGQAHMQGRAVQMQIPYSPCHTVAASLCVAKWVQAWVCAPAHTTPVGSVTHCAHLCELAHAQQACTWADLVSVAVADLCGRKGQLATVEVQQVPEVHKDALKFTVKPGSTRRAQGEMGRRRLGPVCCLDGVGQGQQRAPVG